MTSPGELYYAHPEEHKVVNKDTPSSKKGLNRQSSNQSQTRQGDVRFSTSSIENSWTILEKPASLLRKIEDQISRKNSGSGSQVKSPSSGGSDLNWAGKQQFESKVLEQIDGKEAFC